MINIINQQTTERYIYSLDLSLREGAIIINKKIVKRNSVIVTLLCRIKKNGLMISLQNHG